MFTSVLHLRPGLSLWNRPYCCNHSVLDTMLQPAMLRGLGAESKLSSPSKRRLTSLKRKMKKWRAFEDQKTGFTSLGFSQSNFNLHVIVWFEDNLLASELATSIPFQSSTNSSHTSCNARKIKHNLTNSYSSTKRTTQNPAALGSTCALLFPLLVHILGH